MKTACTIQGVRWEYNPQTDVYRYFNGTQEEYREYLDLKYKMRVSEADCVRHGQLEQRWTNTEFTCWGDCHLFMGDETVLCQYCGKHGELTWYPTINEKLRQNEACFDCDFWLEKVQWKENGDKTESGHQVIRTPNYVQYTIGEKQDKNYPRSCLGHGGRTFVFKLFKDDSIITSNNVWYQGEIPEHFRDKLPPNADHFTVTGRKPTKGTAN